jgi:hypothetical protein
MTTTFVAMNHRGPIATALTVEAAQWQSLRSARQNASAAYDYIWVDAKPGEWQLLRKPAGKRNVPAERTAYRVVEVALIPDEATTVSGPFPIKVAASPGGADVDVSAFLFQAVFTELITKASDAPKELVAELADMADLMRSAMHAGRNSQARHEFDERMQQMLTEYANGGVIPVYGPAVGRMAERLTQIATPRPVPGQRQAGAA